MWLANQRGRMGKREASDGGVGTEEKSRQNCWLRKAIENVRQGTAAGDSYQLDRK